METEVKMKVKSFTIRIAMAKIDDEEINDETIETALLDKFNNLLFAMQIVETENKEF